jgi:hypothetical protein
MLSVERMWRRARLVSSIERGYDFEQVEIELQSAERDEP